jgi:transcriptional regulator with GAF, ATPase, and Fis domain
MESITSPLLRIQERIATYGKENLEEILFSAAEGIRLISGRESVRIYVEDLTRGALTCVYATGAHAAELKGTTFPIVSGDSLVSRVFAGQSPAEVTEPGKECLALDEVPMLRFGIVSTFMLPITDQGRSIGVICIDRDSAGKAVPQQRKTILAEFVGVVAAGIDQARKYHQQILLTRRVEEYKRREAAALMVQSAVRLIDRLSLASVLVPTYGIPGETRLVVLASHSPDPGLKTLYEELGSISLRDGKSLVGRYLGDDAAIVDEQLLKPVFIPDLQRQTLQKKALTEKMALRSLYMVPRYEPDSRKIICLVNYYSRENFRFSDFEMGLLQTHAEMVERVIREIGGEHLEVRVLAEITDLLQEHNEQLQPFLAKVLSKATELIGADTGSIAVVLEQDGEKRLVVEDGSGEIIGAKNKVWLKKTIPRFRIGGPELPPEERSLTGYVAWAKQPKILANVTDEARGEGFHRSMSDLIKSEIAMPLICDDQVMGVICLNSLKQGYFTEEHKRILQIIDRLTSRHISDLRQIESLQSEVVRLTRDVAYKDPHVSSYRLGNIIGNSRKTQEIVEFINTVSQPLFNRIVQWNTSTLHEATIGLPSILVLGETGSGKEFFFNNLYNNLNEMYRKALSQTGELPVKKTNIAAYSGELTYSELFGHKKGAFTGAYNDRKGILEEAQGGIVFLDEIGDADPKTQVQLLRFLDNGGLVRLGENAERYGRVLLVAATNRNLHEEIRAGRFREDLYHRLSELSVRIPSLADRREDIPDLAVHFLGKLYRTYRGKDDPPITPLLTEGAKKALVNHSYEGNVRELRSILLRALFFRTGNTISENDIRQAIRDGLREQPADARGRLKEQLAMDILAQIESGGDFWTEVYEPYTKNRLPKDVVLVIIDKSRRNAGRTMPQIARYLKAVTGDIAGDQEERKKFFKFKNFLYKTIRV